MELLYDPAVPFLSAYTKKMKIIIQKDTCIPVFTTLFTVAKIWKQPKYSQMAEWIKRMWYMYSEKHYPALKRMKYCHL